MHHTSRFFVFYTKQKINLKEEFLVTLFWLDMILSKFVSFVEDTFQRRILKCLWKDTVWIFGLLGASSSYQCSVPICSVIQLQAKYMHLFYESCNLFLYFLFKFGYQTAVKVWLNKCISHFLLIRIHSMQGGTASLKVLSATFVQVYFLSLNKSTCQTRKNVFYFTSKALFVREKIKF